MNNKIRILLAASASLLGAASSSPVFAWGCVAVSENGTNGYSYNYDNQGDASDRALNECAKRATTDQTCEITDCNQDW
jgi:hypothetical protein